MDPLPHFSRSYAEARAKFVAAARAAGHAVETHLMPDRTGVDGEPLAIDVALAGSPTAQGVLVLTSATHGIEGYCGSGVQIALMHDAGVSRTAVDSGVAVVWVHAVNPHGFSFGRRVNEDNVDLNRNFRDFSVPPPVNAGYADIHDLLLPPHWPPSAEHEAKSLAYIAAHGARTYQTAVTGGQYAYPDGLFYGGTRATWSNRTMRAVLRRHAAGRRRFGWIDIHTGLGPRGLGEKIFAGRNDAADLARTRAWWGAEVTSIYDASSSSAELTGLMFNSAYEECAGVEYTGIGLEYGTLPLPAMLLALRADHWLHLHPEAPPALRASIRQGMRDAFYIDADDWKIAVVAQARDATSRALACLAKA
ncbi:MAG: M14 family metallopeptidase [Betaproteobacteria bacterium]